MRLPPLRSTLRPNANGEIDFRGIREWLQWFEDIARSCPTRGTGSPEGRVIGSVGDLYCRTDGGASTVLYVKESGTNTKTGWVAK